MDWNRIEGNWKQFKGQAKEKWGRLTDDSRSPMMFYPQVFQPNCASATRRGAVPSPKSEERGATPGGAGDGAGDG